MYGKNQVFEKLIMDFYTLQILCIVSFNSQVTLFKEKVSNVLIQEELVGFEIPFKPLNFPPSYADYP